MSINTSMNKGFKVVIMGQTNVGKTSLIKSLIYKDDKFNIHEPSTIGAAYYCKKIQNNASPESYIKVDFWDTAGQERYNSMLKLYYRNADIVILVFDFETFDESFSKCNMLLKEVSEENQKTKFILVGNKTDLIKKTKFDELDIIIKNFKSKYDSIIEYIPSSVLEHKNIDNINKVINEYVNKTTKNNTTNDIVNTNPDYSWYFTNAKLFTYC